LMDIGAVERMHMRSFLQKQERVSH
jgi:hypothetical protein